MAPGETLAELDLAANSTTDGGLPILPLDFDSSFPGQTSVHVDIIPISPALIYLLKQTLVSSNNIQDVVIDNQCTGTITWNTRNFEPYERQGSIDEVK